MRNERLMLREEPREQLTTRSLSLRADSVNEEARTVDGIISTEAPVVVYDWMRGEVIEEILLNDGAQLPDQLPLLDNHNRWSNEAVLGSAINFLRESSAAFPGIAGRMQFVTDDPDVDKIWNKVRQKHIRDLSVGYSVDEKVEIAPGQTALVAGRNYTAGKRTLRIATKWTPKEVSITPIGADKGAKLRGEPMNPQLRAYLESIGLRKDASDAEAQAFYRGLQGEQRTQADGLANGQRNEPVNTPPTPPAPEPTRTAPPANPPAPPAGESDLERGARLENERVRAIQDLGGSDVSPEIVRQAISDRWDVARASREFLNNVRSSRNPATPPAGPAVHSRSHEVDCNVRSLTAGLLSQQGLDPTRARMTNGRSIASRSAFLTSQDADLGDRFRSMSAMDLVRECARIDTGRHFYDQDEMMRAAFSGATLSYVFSTNVYARLMAGWDLVPDTTGGWCDEEDVANFLQQEDISLTANANPDLLPRGGTANHATASDSHETYKIARFAKQIVFDEQDVIDDRLGALMRMQGELGEAMRRLRPNLVYSLILENPNLVADGGAVFNSTAVSTAGGHNNLGTGALSDANLKLAISAMGSQRLGDDVLNIAPKYLIVPSALDWQAQGLTTAASLAKLFADSNDPIYTTENLIARKRLVPVMDDRIGAAGVRDPKTKTVRTGSATNWFLTAGGSRGLRVAYRRGTGRLPQMRSFVLDRGQWGMGWDINFDIGAAFMDYRYWYKSTGAA
jgi:hypothetical protein